MFGVHTAEIVFHPGLNYVKYMYIFTKLSISLFRRNYL